MFVNARDFWVETFRFVCISLIFCLIWVVLGFFVFACVRGFLASVRICALVACTGCRFGALSTQRIGGLMSLSFRQSDILEIARVEGRVVVEDLASRFAVTVQTIRRDLTELADAGKLERVHGGAVLPSGVTNLHYEDRRALSSEAKTRIARACVANIPDGASLCLNIGTTTEAVARELLHHRNLMVVTNNINIAQILGANESCEIILTGGSLRPLDGGLVGDMAVATIQQFKFDMAVIGCSAVDPAGDLLDYDLQEVSTSRAILQSARTSCLVADHSKFLRQAPGRIASMAQIDHFYTDQPLTVSLQSQCRDWGTRVVVAS